jgi:hypothetical protein
MARVAEDRIREIRVRYEALAPVMDERATRLWVAAEAKSLGRGGIAAVTTATSIRGKRIAIGMREVAQMELTQRAESGAGGDERPARSWSAWGAPAAPRPAWRNVAVR